ncbi:hypothetical protein EVAR_18854_1 [Eumeta japonica]|uniref:Uncharacterized protein n=1 Tax=Eumeta variegata TaxID=151549 RepID=A0A4C1UMQ5_EUMVA|nr:hypothetical protein EVAR_18854_1 [Eumeta japonica]
MSFCLGATRRARLMLMNRPRRYINTSCGGARGPVAASPRPGALILGKTNQITTPRRPQPRGRRSSRLSIVEEFVCRMLCYCVKTPMRTHTKSARVTSGGDRFCQVALHLRRGRGGRRVGGVNAVVVELVSAMHTNATTNHRTKLPLRSGPGRPSVRASSADWDGRSVTGM